ncbi:MAG: alginate O-acetyltransferase complex protein AlgJ [Acidobacteriota bacterium]|jgi:hypothetical protein|nr:alginate O-acetyltransferase complex protein AlgJ [Acidobacteriota bacterium]
MSNGQKIRATAETSLIVLFMVVLWLPILGMCFHWGVMTSAQENRRLAVFPSLSTDPRVLAAFPANFKIYFQDNFGFRDTLIRWQALARVKLLGVSSSPQVILGKEGWLFHAVEYSNKGEPLIPPFNEEQLARWQRFLEGWRDWLAQRGIRYLFTVAPGKHTIYPEYLPDTFRRDRTSRLDQLIAYLKEHSTLEILDLRPALFKAKASHLLYHKTDTHWNYYGGLVAYQAIFRELGGLLTGQQMISESDCLVATQKYTGDLVRMLGLTGVITEEIQILSLPKQEYTGADGQPISSPKVDEITISKREGARLPRMVMMMDSFSQYLFRFFAPHFSRASFVWRREFDPEFINGEHPDILIQEMAEVHLMNDPPAEAPGISRGSEARKE